MAIYYSNDLEGRYFEPLKSQELENEYNYLINNSTAFMVRYKYVKLESDEKLANVITNLGRVIQFCVSNASLIPDVIFREYISLYGISTKGLIGLSDAVIIAIDKIVRNNKFYWKEKLGNPSFKEMVESMKVVKSD